MRQARNVIWCIDEVALLEVAGHPTRVWDYMEGVAVFAKFVRGPDRPDADWLDITLYFKLYRSLRVAGMKHEDAVMEAVRRWD